jgi:AMMECR1 domain-containing protein
MSCVLEESPKVVLELAGGAAAVEQPCSSPLGANEIARIRLDTGVLQGARIALPDNELLSILDMEA